MTRAHVCRSASVKYKAVRRKSDKFLALGHTDGSSSKSRDDDGFVAILSLSNTADDAEALMSFQNRLDAYRWSESARPQGPCGLVVASGGFNHLFLLEPARGQVEMYYLGMRDPRRRAR
jgi:hypothetical protein